jgi:hypothetical protein
VTATSSQIALPEPTSNSRAQATIWAMAPMRSLPRTSVRRPVAVATMTAVRTSAAARSGRGRGQSAPFLQPLGVAVEKGVGHDEGQLVAAEGGQQGKVAAEQPQVDERLRGGNLWDAAQRLGGTTGARPDDGPDDERGASAESHR